MFDPHERDGYNDPYIYLRDKFRELGYDLRTADNYPPERCARILFFDAPTVRPYHGLRGKVRKFKTQFTGRPLVRDLYHECLQLGLHDRLALFLWEPPSVCRANWEPSLHRLFSTILTWHDGFVDGKRFHKILWPQTRKFPNVPQIPFAKKKLLVNISMNKHSRHPRELYSARRSTILYFERRMPAEFDLYGVGWDRPLGLAERTFPLLRSPYQSYRGPVRNKWDVLPYYRFSVCYENMSDEPGYLTEKIFDSMRSGCVPIYWGAQNVTDYVDSNIFIDRRRFSSDADLEHFLIGMSETDYGLFQDAISDYLASERFKRFLPPAFAETVIRVLDL